MLAQPPLTIVQLGGGALEGIGAKLPSPPVTLHDLMSCLWRSFSGTELTWGLPCQLRAVFPLLFYPVRGLSAEALKEEEVPLWGFGPEAWNCPGTKAHGLPGPPSGSVTWCVSTVGKALPCGLHATERAQHGVSQAISRFQAPNLSPRLLSGQLFREASIGSLASRGTRVQF